MAEGLIKITGEEHLYYDSIMKQYKSVMHCPNCGKVHWNQDKQEKTKNEGFR